MCVGRNADASPGKMKARSEVEIALSLRIFRSRNACPKRLFAQRKGPFTCVVQQRFAASCEDERIMSRQTAFSFFKDAEMPQDREFKF